MVPTIRLMVMRSGTRYFIYNRGMTFVMQRADGSQAALGLITHEPVMFMFALEDALLSKDNPSGMAMKAAKAFLGEDCKINLIHTVTKPIEDKDPAIELEAAGINLTEAHVS
jgi:hypothetical protein